MASRFSVSRGQGRGLPSLALGDLREKRGQVSAPAVPQPGASSQAVPRLPSVEERREAAPASPGLRGSGEGLRIGRTWEFAGEELCTSNMG